MALDRWQQQLCDLLTAVHGKQQQYDQAARACQTLLKPWPKNSREDESATKKDLPDGNDKAAGAPVNPCEEAELNIVNDLLKRAQKTRVKTISKKEHVCPADDDLPSSRTGKELWEICDSTAQTNQELVLTGDARSSISKPVPAIKPDDSIRKNISSARSENSRKNAVKKQPDRVQPARERRDQSSYSATKHHQSVSSVKKPVSSVDQKRSKSTESMGSSRPPSRPRSSRGSFKPVHTTAPFKTDPNLHFPKRSAKNIVRPIKQHPAGKRQNFAGDRNHVSKVLPPISSEEAIQSSVLGDQEDGALPEVSCGTQAPLTNGDLQLRTEHRTVLSQGETLNSELSSLTLGSDSTHNVAMSLRPDVGVMPTHPEDASSNSEEKQETKLFSLLSNGSSITIPAKVRRAFARNQQLRRKMAQRDQGRKLRSEGDSLGQKFADKLQQLFDPEEELLYRQQALECLHTHQQLLHLLTQLNLDHPTEASSAGDILRAKMLAEFVLSSFSAFSEEVNFFSKVQFSGTPTVVEPPHKQVGHPYLWLPPSIQGDNLCSADRLQYSSKKDLNRYMNVLLQLQSLKCQRHLLDILVSDVLPWLLQQDCHQEDFGAVFRGLFALLTSDGSQLPVLIRDSVQ